MKKDGVIMKKKYLKSIMATVALALIVCGGNIYSSDIKADSALVESATEPTVEVTTKNETTSAQVPTATKNNVTTTKKTVTTTHIVTTKTAERKMPIKVKNPKIKKGYLKKKPCLYWNKDKNNNGYEIFVSVRKNGKYKKIAATSKNRFKLSKLEDGKVHYIKVAAYKKAYKKIYRSKKTPKAVAVLTNIGGIKVNSVFAGTVNVSWNVSKNVDGYYVQYSRNKNFKNAGTMKVSSNLGNSVKIYDLIRDKNYYIRIRTYKKLGKKNIYSLWSQAKTIKVAGISVVMNGGFKSTDGFFKDSVFIGDSVLQGFQIYVKSKGKGYLDGTKVSGVVSYSLTAAIQSSSKYHPLYKGKHIPPQEYVKKQGAKKVFLSFGINDIHNTKNPTDTYTKYKQLINNIKRGNPGVKIYILSTTPPMKGSEDYVNYARRIRELNVKMRTYCDNTDCEYIDIAPYLSTSDGYLRSELCSDKFVHQTIQAYALWDKALRNYAWISNH